jgi:hypothetical protein
MANRYVESWRLKGMASSIFLALGQSIMYTLSCAEEEEEEEEEEEDSADCGV